MQSYLYTYYIPSINAIKIGFGGDPKARMLDYTKIYQLQSDINTLRSWPLPIPGIASHIEKNCHDAFKNLGFHQKFISSSQGEAQEIFELFDVKYFDAVKIVEEILQEQAETLIAALRAPKKRIENHRQRDIARFQYLERINKQRSEIEQLTEECSRIIRNNLAPKIFTPLSNVLDKAKLILSQVPPVPKKRFYEFRRDVLTPCDILYNWERREELVYIMIEVFHLDRKLRYSQLKLFQKYYKAAGGEYMNIVEKGAELAGHNFWRPAPKHRHYNYFQILYTHKNYSTKQLVALEEVIHAVQSIAGFAGPMALRFFEETPKLQGLRTFAFRNLPPELIDEFAFAVSSLDERFVHALKRS